MEAAAAGLHRLHRSPGLQSCAGATFSRANSMRLMLFSMNGTLLRRETNRATPPQSGVK